MISSLAWCHETKRYVLDIPHDRDRIFAKQSNAPDLVFVVKVVHRTNGYGEFLKILGRSYPDG